MTPPYKNYSEQEWRSEDFKKRLAFVYTNKLFADVRVGVCLAGKERVFMAHKNILAAYSSVLEDRIYGNESKDLSYFMLDGIDPQGLAYVLKLLYHVPPSPRKDIDRSIVLSAYHAAMTLGIHNIETDLKQEILDEILTHSLVTRDDFWKILELSIILKIDDITGRLLRFAESNSKAILRAKSLIKASPTTLKTVIDLDKLRTSEMDVLYGIVRWREENLKLPFVGEFMQDLLGCVRFRSLSSLDLCQFLASKSDLISSDDVLGIMMHLGNPTSIPLPPWCSKKFRCSITSLSTVHPDERSSKNTNCTMELPSKINSRVSSTTFLRMYLEQKHTDVCFLVGKARKQMKAHRNIMAIGSFVFEKMFFSKLAYSPYVIEVPFEDPESFNRMLMYFYDDSNPDSLFKKKDVAEKTFNAAMKYGSTNLKRACLKFYTPGNIKPKTFWKNLGSMINQLAEIKSLKHHLEYAVMYTQIVLSCAGFMDASLEAVGRVLQLDRLSVKEIEVLYYVARWLEQNAKLNGKEKSSYDLLSLIRFGAITSEEFCSFSEEYGKILPQQEMLSIQLHLGDEAVPLPPWCYKGSPRQLVPWNKILEQQEEYHKHVLRRNQNVSKYEWVTLHE